MSGETANDGSVRIMKTETGSTSHLEEKLKQFSSTTNEERKSFEVKTEKAEKLRRRNLVFDEERFEDVFLRCLICRDVYNEAERTPKMLPCHHSFCLNCFLEMFRVEGEYRQTLTSAFRGMPRAVKIQCPTCRIGIIASEDDLRRLPSDHTILELLSFIQETGITDIAYCPKHQLQSLNFFCERCATPVCSDCTVLDHKEQNGHVVMNMKEALSKYTPIINATISRMEERKQEFLQKREQIEFTVQTISRMEQSETQRIKTNFQKLREVLDKREREILYAAEEEVGKRRMVLQATLNRIVAQEEGIFSQQAILETAKGENDISQMFSSYQEAQKTLAQPLELADNADTHFKITFHANPNDQKLIVDKLVNFGDVMVQSC